MAHIENGSASGQHCATKERRNFGGHISGHGYHGVAVDDRMCGKRRHAEMMLHDLAASAQSQTSTEQRASTV